MSVMKRLAVRAGRVAVLGALTIGLTAGLTAPASAAPRPTGATLTIFKVNDSSYKVYINGVFKMSEADAVGFINNLGTGTRAKNGGGEGGIYYHAEFTVPASALNEDGARFGNQRDEIFADAQFVDGDNGTRRHVSNLIERYF